ncbi:sperm-tail PG-rich repeat-containing protein 2 [Rhinophrynus dorsalis]
MYDRAPRSLVTTLGSTQENVGPGSYDIIPEKPLRSGEEMTGLGPYSGGHAPFLSMAKRDFSFDIQQCVAPGPGHYEISKIKDKVKGGQTIQNKEKRFKESVSYIPGPGAYDVLLGVESDGPKNNESAKPQKRVLSHMKRQYKPGAPSIPIPGQAFGYEETEDGSLVKQVPPTKDNSLGPAYYQPTNNEAYATIKYKGTHFGKYTGKRTEFKYHEGPGPGEYDIDQESALHYENVNSKKEDKKKYEPFIPRYHEVIVLQEEKKGVPGPGNYDITCQFGERLTKSANIPQPPFLSKSKRFLPVKSITPAPGTYNEQRTAFESLKKTSSLAQTPFGQTAVRFPQDSRLHKTPGPGTYDLFSLGFANESIKKAYWDSTQKGAFGSSAVRALSISSRDAVWTPGPAHYTIKDNIEEPYKQQTSSVFSSGTERLTSLINAKDSPSPGSYNVCESFEMSHAKGRYRPPRTLQAKRKQACFLSASPRALPVQNGIEVPGDTRRKYRTRRGKRKGKNKEEGQEKQNAGTTASGNNIEDKTIINLTDVDLEESHVSLLRKGLSFSPTCNNDKFEMVKDLHLFSRKVLLKFLHSRPACAGADDQIMKDLEDLLKENVEEVSDQRFTKLKPKSKCMPPLTLNSNIKVFTELVEKDISSLSMFGLFESNLVKDEFKVMKELSINKEIIIKPSDKGGNVVILSEREYVAEIQRQINNKECYEQLEGDPTENIQLTLNRKLRFALEENLISNNEYKYMTVESPKDTRDVLRRLVDLEVCGDSVLVTLDVESLYTSIPHECGIRACREFLDTRGPGTYNPVMKSATQVPLSVPREERFKVPKEVTPGPGTYELSSVLKDTVLKGTFNATLPNPLLKEMESNKLKDQAWRQSFTLSV